MCKSQAEVRDLASATKWIRRLLFADMALCAVSWLSDIAEFRLLSDLGHAVFETQAEAIAAAGASDERQAVLGVLQTTMLLVLMVTIGRWIYFANRNANAQVGESMHYSPGWAVGCYFVPIVNFWKPYRAMKEIWQVSANPAAWRAVRVPGLLRWWWFFWILTGLVGHLAFRLGLQANTLPALQAVNVMTQIVDVLSIPLDMTVLALTGRIAGMQRQWAARPAAEAPGAVS